jgi:hypothetical protein
MLGMKKKTFDGIMTVFIQAQRDLDTLMVDKENEIATLNGQLASAKLEATKASAALKKLDEIIGG